MEHVTREMLRALGGWLHEGPNHGAPVREIDADEGVVVHGPEVRTD